MCADHLPYTAGARGGSRLGRSTFLIRQVLEADPDSDEPPGTASLGWIALPIFADPDRLNGGFWRLPLFHPPINVGKTKEARHVDG